MEWWENTVAIMCESWAFHDAHPRCVLHLFSLFLFVLFLLLLLLLLLLLQSIFGKCFTITNAGLTRTKRIELLMIHTGLCSCNCGCCLSLQHEYVAFAKMNIQCINAIELCKWNSTAGILGARKTSKFYANVDENSIRTIGVKYRVWWGSAIALAGSAVGWLAEVAKTDDDAFLLLVERRARVDN